MGLVALEVVDDAAVVEVLRDPARTRQPEVNLVDHLERGQDARHRQRAKATEARPCVALLARDVQQLALDPLVDQQRAGGRLDDVEESRERSVLKASCAACSPA